jgi:hypothetical protein
MHIPPRVTSLRRLNLMSLFVHSFSHHVISLNLCSLLYIETADRPGLLLEIIKIINDTNVDVESAEIDTEV